MSNTVTTAPGKIVVCGEYVVLDGAPAIVTAINRRAQVQITPATGDRHTVRCPGYAEMPSAFSITPEFGFAWEPGAADLTLLEEVWRAVRFEPASNLDLSLDSSAFVDTGSGKKLGLGSSAALTVALSAAFTESIDALPGLNCMIEIHRGFQGARGSGIDVAVARHGGTMEYRMHADPCVRPLPWPEGLRYAIVWSGSPSSTVQKIQAFGSAEPQHNSRRRLAQASADIAAAWTAAMPQRLLELFGNYVVTLREFDLDHGLGIFDAGHGKLVELASDTGVAYKPCGAGGGDVGIALSDSDRLLDSFVDAARSSGFEPLDLRIEPIGLTKDEANT